MEQAIVTLERVGRRYYMGQSPVDALREVSLQVCSGEYAAIMGPSGSGKSTLLNLLGCLDRPTSGRYLLGGEDVSKLGDDALSQVRARRIGFVFQSFNLIPQLSVVENIEVPLMYAEGSLREARQRATALATRLGLAERLQHRPRELSGGQQQRVALARALATNPLVLLADEPTGNLDSRTGAEVMALFDELHGEGKTILMVTHDEEVAARAERVVHLRDGCVERETRRGEEVAP